MLFDPLDFSADPDQSFFLNADPDPDPGRGAKPILIHADPDHTEINIL
jgi:hypothetical protein